MIYARGPNGSAAIRVTYMQGQDALRCVFLNDQSSVIIDRSTDATFLTGLRALDAKIVALIGQPQIVSDMSELV